MRQGEEKEGGETLISCRDSRNPVFPPKKKKKKERKIVRIFASEILAHQKQVCSVNIPPSPCVDQIHQ